MDFTAAVRSTNPGTGIGTNFGSIPYGNTVQGNLSEVRLSGQNSRVGIRVDALVHGAKVLGYLESDFLGALAGNAAVTSNSNGLRMRVYFVDARKGKVEFLGGQSWSMLTPGRKGISPLPGDLFYSQDIDVNYQNGLVWSRNAQFRLLYHPNEKVTLGLSLENPEQYIGGSGGGGVVTLPSSLQSSYSSQFNSGGSGVSVPNMHPDIIGKVAVDTKWSGMGVHFDAAGIVRSFRAYNPATSQRFRATGGGASANLILSPWTNFRLISLNYWSSGGGRWIFGEAPDLIVRGDGGLSPIKAGSTIQGFEAQAGATQFSAYYGGVYVGRNVTVDPVSRNLAGYGFSGSSGSHNRVIHEVTFNMNRTIWKDARYGALNLMLQYSYLLRKPWFVSNGAPDGASSHMGFLNLRYTLPGSAPTLQ